MDRALPDRSHLEINKCKERVGSDLHAKLYLYKRDKLIITSVSGNLETGEPTILSADSANLLVGETLCDHLLQFQFETPALAGLKQSDWGAYRASRARSISSFQSHSWVVQVATTGGNSIAKKAAPCKSLYPEIGVEGVARPRHEEVGAILRRTLESAFAVRAAGLI